MLKQYVNKKILILGLGVNQGGVGSAKFFAKSQAQVRVTDLKNKKQLKSSLNQLKKFKNIKYILGLHRNEDIKWADLIIRNPALKPDNKFLKYAKKLNKNIETDMGIFLKFVNPEQIIGVTGSKGKSTTASLIFEVLKNEGKQVLFAGNIGKSVLDAIAKINKNTLVVLEISSFQLEAFDEHKISPKWAIITNIYPDHLNYYSTMKSYTASKKLIAINQTENDFLFIKKGDEIVDKPEFLKGLKGKLVYFSKDDLPKNYLPTLPGNHNRENIAAAISFLKTLKVDQKKSLKISSKFHGVEFRLQKIYDKNGIKIFNDSSATNPDATMAALKSFPNSILIAGGVNKKLDYDELTREIDNLAKAVFFLEGDSTDQILKSIKNEAKVRGIYNNLEKILKDIKPTLKTGDVILFSPGAASFNLFQNEFDRGRKFNYAVKKLFK